jgi:hypothetical protein
MEPEVGFEPSTLLRVGCSASAWTAPDGSSLLRLDALSVQTAPEGSRRIVWMIIGMIKAHPTKNRMPRQAASRLIAPGCGSWTNAGFGASDPTFHGVRRPSPQIGTTCGVHAGAWRALMSTTPPDDRGLCILLVPIKGLVDGLSESVDGSDEEEGDEP